jgi:tripartite-type tricarboxylate transporter receptor subunit TctC
VQDFESTAWFGVFGPAHLPADITNKLNAAIVAVECAPGAGQVEVSDLTG